MSPTDKAALVVVVFFVIGVFFIIVDYCTTTQKGKRQRWNR